MKIIRHSVGDQVIALTNSPDKKCCQPRVKGQVYTVKAVSYCPDCGVQSINIGPTSSLDILECHCGNWSNTRGLHWTYAKHFATPQQIKEKINEAVEVENYETAQELHNLINH